LLSSRCHRYIKRLGKQQDNLNDYAAQLTSRFDNQLTALNSLMAQARWHKIVAHKCVPPRQFADKAA
jgi:hypothetical protein